MGHLGRRIDGHIRFQIGPGGRSMSGQIEFLGQIFKSSIFLNNMAMVFRFVSRFQKCHLFLLVTCESSRNCFPIKCRHHFYLLFTDHYTDRNTDIFFEICMFAFIFCIHVVTI